MTRSEPGAAAALERLDSERSNLVSVCARAADGWPLHITRLAAILLRYLDRGGHDPDALAIFTHARRAACQIADRAGEAQALTNLGIVHLRQADYLTAADFHGQALEIYQAIGDHGGEAGALHNLAP